MGKTSCKKGEYYCNTDQKCKPIPDGYSVGSDGILVKEEKHSDHEPEMIRSQLKTAGRASKRIEKHSRKKKNFKAWVQSKITKASDYLDTAADYLDSKDDVKEGSLHKWFSGSKSKDGTGGWVNVKTGGTCASDEPGEGVPKCVSRAKYDSMSKKERESAHRRKRAADPGQQEKTGAAKPTYVSTDKKSKKKKKMKKESTEFTSLPLVLEVPQSDGEFKCGLMFRESLELDRGMLFIFENDDYHTFHMKNTFIPLDIAFIKEDGTIDSIKELDPMSPIPVYPDSEVRYAVEVNRGWFEANDVNVGDALLEEEDLTEGKDKKGKGSGTKDACYHKVKSRYSVWPSAYASGALVKCRKVGAANWGNKSESVEYELNEKEDSRAQQMAKERILAKQKKEGFNTTGVKGITKKGDKVFHKGRQLTQYGISQLNKKDGDFSEKGKERRAREKLENSMNEGKVSGEIGFPDNSEEAKNRRKELRKQSLERDRKYKAVHGEHYDWRETIDEGKSKLVQMGVKAVKNIVPKVKGGGIKKITVGSGLSKVPKNLPKVPNFTPTKPGTFTKIGSGSGGSGGGKTFGGKFGDAFKRNAGALTTGGIVGAEIQNAVNQGKIKELESELENQQTELENEKRINSYYRGLEDGIVKGSKSVTKKNKNLKDHYSWRSSFDNEELDEQLLGAIRRAGSAVGSAVGGAVQKVGNALKSRPIQGRVSRSSQNMAGKPKPQQQTQQKQPAPQAQQTQQQTPAPKMGRTEVANREKLGDARVDALKAKNQEFQAAKKSGNLAQYRQDNPKLSGRERAQAMAKARIAARNAQSNSPTAQKPSVDKVPPAGTPVRKVTSSTTQSGNTTSTQTNVQSGVKGGTTNDLVSSSGSLQKNKLKAKQLANNANKNAQMSGSGATTTVGKIDDF